MRPEPLPTRRGILGATFSDAADAALSLHPAFYVLLAGAMGVLGFASLPARDVPSPVVGAALARRRAEVTLVGIAGLLAVLVAYLLALSS